VTVCAHAFVTACTHPFVTVCAHTFVTVCAHHFRACARHARCWQRLPPTQLTQTSSCGHGMRTQMHTHMHACTHAHAGSMRSHTHARTLHVFTHTRTHARRLHAFTHTRTHAPCVHTHAHAGSMRSRPCWAYCGRCPVEYGCPHRCASPSQRWRMRMQAATGAGQQGERLSQPQDLCLPCAHRANRQAPPQGLCLHSARSPIRPQ